MDDELERRRLLLREIRERVEAPNYRGALWHDDVLAMGNAIGVDGPEIIRLFVRLLDEGYLRAQPQHDGSLYFGVDQEPFLGAAVSDLTDKGLRALDAPPVEGPSSTASRAQDDPLEPALAGLLMALGEAHERTSIDRREEFYFGTASGSPYNTHHPGLPDGGIISRIGDLQMLDRLNLVLLREESRRGTYRFALTPAGLAEYRHAKQALEAVAREMAAIEEVRQKLAATGTEVLDVRLVCTRHEESWRVKRLSAKRFATEPPFATDIEYPNLRVLRDTLTADEFMRLLRALAEEGVSYRFQGVALADAPFRLRQWHRRASGVGSGLGTSALPVRACEGDWLPPLPPDTVADHTELAGGEGRYFARAIAGEAWYLFGVTFLPHHNALPSIDITLEDPRGYIEEVTVNGDACLIRCAGTALSDCRIEVSTSTGQWERRPAAVSVTVNLADTTAQATVALVNAEGWLDKREVIMANRGTGENQNDGESAPRGAIVTDPSERDFDVAFSFAGPQRPLAEHPANMVREAGFSVFYDAFYRAELWGKDLYTFFDDIYRKRARFCVILVSQEYIDRIWTNKERQSAQARALNEKGDAYILPIKVENVELAGMPPTIGYERLDSNDLAALDDIGRVLIEKLRLPGSAATPPSSAATVPTLESHTDSAIEAIENSRPNAEPLIRAYTTMLLEQLEARSPRPTEGIPDDDTLVAALDATPDIVADFARIARTVALYDDARAARALYRGFAPLVERMLRRDNEVAADYYRFVGRELFVTLASFLLYEERWDLLADLLDEEFYVPNLPEGPSMAAFSYLYQPLDLLQRRKERLGLNRYSLLADILAERHRDGALGQRVPLNQFIDADWFLFLRQEERDGARFVWPHSALYMDDHPRFLVQARSARFAQRLLAPLQLADIDALRSRSGARIRDWGSWLSGSTTINRFRFFDSESLGSR